MLLGASHSAIPKMPSNILFDCWIHDSQKSTTKMPGDASTCTWADSGVRWELCMLQWVVNSCLSKKGSYGLLVQHTVLWLHCWFLKQMKENNSGKFDCLLVFHAMQAAKVSFWDQVQNKTQQIRDKKKWAWEGEKTSLHTSISKMKLFQQAKPVIISLEALDLNCPPPPTLEKELQMKFYIIILITEYCCMVYRHCPINNLPIWSKKRATESWLIGRVELSGGCNAWRSPAPMEKRTCGPPVQQIGLTMEKERMAVLSDW